MLACDVELQRVDMPAGRMFTSVKRGDLVFIPWGLPEGKEWGYAFAIIPALLLMILLFVEVGLIGLVQ